MTTGLGYGRYVIIPTHNRHVRVTALAVEMSAQADQVIIIDNASDPALDVKAINAERFQARMDDDRPGRGLIGVWRDEEQPPNLSRLWQAGLYLAAAAGREAGQSHWDVAILNDDVIIPDGWLDAVASAMRASPAAAACSAPGGLEVSGRHPRWLTGWAMVIRGELAAKPGDPLWPDDRLRWWGGDTLLDIRAQQNGGSLRVPGLPVIANELANTSTVDELAEQAGRDRETFKEITGWYAW